jgi:hypothetical protein
MLFHHEWLAVRKSLESVLKYYPNCQIILGRDELAPEINKELSLINYEYINTRSCMEKFVLLNKTGDGLKDFPIEDLFAILHCHVERAYDVAMKAQHEFILFLEPDGYMKHKHSPNLALDMETLTPNPYNQNVIDFVNKISPNKLKIHGWGFVVGFVRKEAILRMHTWFDQNPNTIKELMEIDRRFAYMDFSFPLLAHMSQSRVGKSKKIVECNRSKFWRFSRKPLLHQFKEFHNV